MANKWPPASKNTDPESSHEAETIITASGVREKQVQWAFDLVRKHPNMTAKELASMVGGGDKYKTAYYGIRLARRLSDLKNMNKVKAGNMRKCMVSKRKAVTWSIIPEAPAPESFSLTSQEIR